MPKTTKSAKDDFDFDFDPGDFEMDDIDLDAEVPASPLAGVKYTGSVEADSQAEASEILKAFRERAKAEQERVKNATDSEHWCAICFQTREQKEQFLRALDLIELGDKYLDGLKVAKRLGVSLAKTTVSYKPGKVDPKLAKLAR